MKKSIDKSPYFHDLVNHISFTWRKLKGYPYPFSGSDFRELKNASRIFTEWGTMGLWDTFLASESDWVKKSGYSVSAFSRCLPWLVDIPGWKEKAREHEIRVCGSLKEEMKEVIKKFAVI